MCLTKSIDQKALDYFDNYNCCQSVLRTILEEKGLMFDEAISIATAFGGGVIGRGEICGAVSGAVMAVGILGRQLFENYQDYKTATRENVKLFYEKFECIFGHSTCNGLIGIEDNDPVAKKRASEAGIYRENCS